MPPRKAPTRQSRPTRPVSHPSHKPHNPRKRGGRGPSGGGKAFIIVGAIIAVALLGWFVWILIPHAGFERSQLDSYLEMEKDSTGLNDGACIYVDFSNGMNYAFADPTARASLKDLLNKSFGTGIEYKALADGKIEPLDMPGLSVYNRILAPSSFSQEQAPIAKTLAEILQARKPALLISDFEEYNGSFIETAAYAKEYFQKWLATCGNIVFYKINYNENGRQKKLFFTVFDNNGALLSMVDAAMMPLMDQGVERFVLAGHNFFYPVLVVSNEYTYMNQGAGGNYHNAEGKDLASGVIEPDGKNNDIAYKRYYGNVGSAFKGKGRYLPLTSYDGQPAEYYPIGVSSWKEVVNNSASLKEAKKDAYTHFLQGLQINFAAQDGYLIEGIEARCFNFAKVIKSFADADKQAKDSTANAKQEAMTDMKLPKADEISDMFEAEMQPAADLPGWYDIYVDFSQKFNGVFKTEDKDTDLLRLNVVISNAKLRTQQVEEFFGWPGNQSLAESVKNALEANSPIGNIVWSYFLKIQE